MLLIRLVKGLSFVKKKVVKKPLEKRGTSLHIWGYTMGKSHSNVISPTARWASLHKDISLTTRGDTPGRDHISVIVAETNLWDHPLLRSILGGIQGKDHINVKNAKKHSQRAGIWEPIKRFMMEKRDQRLNPLERGVPTDPTEWWAGHSPLAVPNSTWIREDKRWKLKVLTKLLSLNLKEEVVKLFQNLLQS